MIEGQSERAPGARSLHRVLSAVRSAVFWLLVAASAVLLWPTSLGGCATLTVVSGHSMEPTYYTGDLVVARCGTPAVGDIVVYQPPELGGRIIHRLVGGTSDGWEVRGDNNDWVDPFTPTDTDVLGVARLHIPKLGMFATVFATPYVWVSLIVIALAVLIWPRDEDSDEVQEASADGDTLVAPGLQR